MVWYGEGIGWGVVKAIVFLTGSFIFHYRGDLQLRQLRIRFDALLGLVTTRAVGVEKMGEKSPGAASDLSLKPQNPSSGPSPADFDTIPAVSIPASFVDTDQGKWEIRPYTSAMSAKPIEQSNII